MRAFPWPAAFLFLVAVSGCASPAGPEADAAPVAGPRPENPSEGGTDAPTPSDAAEPMAFADCRQYHTAFSAQASDLQPLMPRGFTVTTDEAGLAQLAIIATSCGASAGRVAMAWVQVAARPPTELAQANASNHVALEAYLGDPALLAWAHAAGLASAEACDCRDEPSPSPGLLADAFVVDGMQDDYRLQTLLTPDGGAFAGGEAHLYFAQGGEAVARLRIVDQESANRGLGTVALTYQGSGAAPPAFAGVAHVIDGLASTWTVDALEAA